MPLVVTGYVQETLYDRFESTVQVSSHNARLIFWLVSLHSVSSTLKINQSAIHGAWTVYFWLILGPWLHRIQIVNHAGQLTTTSSREAHLVSIKQSFRECRAFSSMFENAHITVHSPTRQFLALHIDNMIDRSRYSVPDQVFRYLAICWSSQMLLSCHVQYHLVSTLFQLLVVQIVWAVQRTEVLRGVFDSCPENAFGTSTSSTSSIRSWLGIHCLTVMIIIKSWPLQLSASLRPCWCLLS